nr:hypothetical protein [Latilactobacillus sakei]
MKQRTFTTRLIPIMEKAGWQYNKKDLKPLEGFHSIDLDKSNDPPRCTQGSIHGYFGSS